MHKLDPERCIPMFLNNYSWIPFTIRRLIQNINRKYMTSIIDSLFNNNDKRSEMIVTIKLN